jgi:hypothetical protein
MSGSRYVLDEENKTFQRLPGPDAKNLYSDGRIESYIQLLYLHKGVPMEILWEQDGSEKIRVTTPVTKIENW